MRQKRRQSELFKRVVTKSFQAIERVGCLRLRGDIWSSQFLQRRLMTPTVTEYTAFYTGIGIGATVHFIKQRYIVVWSLNMNWISTQCTRMLVSFCLCGSVTGNTSHHRLTVCCRGQGCDRLCTFLSPLVPDGHARAISA